MSKKPDIYAVGLLRDLKSLQSGRWNIRQFLFWFFRSWHRRSYWNGYLAESENKSRCGRGWTKRAALRRWERIPEL